MVELFLLKIKLVSEDLIGTKLKSYNIILNICWQYNIIQRYSLYFINSITNNDKMIKN